MSAAWAQVRAMQAEGCALVAQGRNVAIKVAGVKFSELSVLMFTAEQAPAVPGEKLGFGLVCTGSYRVGGTGAWVC
jgi:hypothetical protein